MEGEQLSIYDIEYEKYKITKPIRLIELFAGYGSQALALKYLNVPFEHWKICEWAVKSIQAYKDIHFTNVDIELNSKRAKEEMVEFLYQKGISSNYNEPMAKEQIQRLNEKQLETIIKNIAITHNLVNIQQVKGEDLDIIDTDKFTYLLTYSFPCQDLSNAGKGKGMSDTSTRSGMLWEVERILGECQELGTLPQILLMENVPQVHGVDNVRDFNKWKRRLEELGYNNYFQDLIATDYGIPQTRNRCFMVSILGDYSYQFPRPIPLKLKLKDMLEDEVAEKYFISNKMINYVCSRMPSGDNKITVGISCGNRESLKNAGTLTTNSGNRATDNFIIENNKYDYSKEKGEIINTYDEYNHKINGNETIGTIQAMYSTPNHGHRLILGTYQYAKSDNFMQGKDRLQLGKDVSDTLQTTQKEGIVINRFYEQALETLNNNEVNDGDIIDAYNKKVLNDGNSPTITTRPEGFKTAILPVQDLRIRKLTPKECFRLMGVKDEDYENCKKNQSDSSLYHLAGDSIVVNVLMAIFKKML